MTKSAPGLELSRKRIAVPLALRAHRRHISSRSSANGSRSGKSPTLTRSGLTKAPKPGFALKYLLPSTEPSFFPACTHRRSARNVRGDDGELTGSSYSTPTQTPPFPKATSPTNRTTPLGASEVASDSDATSHRFPTWRSGGNGPSVTVGASEGPKRPSLLRCLNARTESASSS